ncbi:Zinc finger, CCHC-type [Sesbania bispinosa]|nr:Zinc finger, CCHC-type [Sesbania bispinosa]
MERENEVTELSLEERDLLNRSKKKPKVDEGSPSREESLPTGDEDIEQSEGSEQNEESFEESENGEMFETATGMALKRKMVSYKDVCLGVNGGEHSESSDSDYEPSSEEEESECESEDSEMEDVLYGFEEEQTVVRGKFARLCIEVDLRKCLVAKFQLNNQVYAVEYEGLHLVCFACGLYGHRKDSCPNNPEKSQAKKQEDAVTENSPTPGTTPAEDGGSHNQENLQDAYGSWMLVSRNKRRQQTNGNRGGRAESGAKGKGAHGADVANHNGSRFDVLMEDSTENNHMDLMQTVMKEPKEGNQEVTMVPTEEDRVPQTTSIAEVRMDPKKTENVVIPKVDGPNSFRSTKSLARDKGSEPAAEGPKTSVLPKKSGGLISKGGPEVCAQGNKENLEPPPTLILKPNYKKIPSTLGERGVSPIQGLGNGPGVIIGNCRPPDPVVRRKKNKVEALEGVDGAMISDMQTLKGMVVDFFQSLYKEEGTQGALEC